MQFKKSAVVRVLIMLYLSTDSWCHYIPEKETNQPDKQKNAISSNSEQIQICGNALTDFIIKSCKGIMNSLNSANSSLESGKTKITEDCCDQSCSSDYIQSYCGETQLFTLKKTLRGKPPNSLTRNRSSGFGAKDKPPRKEENKGFSEVRIREKKNGNKKVRKSKKKKRSFKKICAHKSFGHYLLKLGRGDRVHDNMAKGKNTIKRLWPSIQIGTISPEVDNFGGPPIVVVKKNKSNSV